MTRSLFAACLILLAAGFSGCKKSDESEAPPPAPRAPPPTPVVLEHEPNDVQHPQSIEPKAIVRGQITPGKKGAADDDWYRVTAGPGMFLALHVELTADEPMPSAQPQPPLGPLDAQLEIDDRDRNRLVLTRATSGEPALLPAVACFESCFVHVWGAAPAAYKLTVLGAPPQEGEELEPNNRAIDATPLSAGKSITGTIGAPDDEDWFRVTAQARPGQFLRVELSGVAGVRPELELRALSDGALLATFRAPAAGEGIFLRDLSISGDIAPPSPPQLRPILPDAGPADAGVTSADSNPEKVTSDAGAASQVTQVTPQGNDVTPPPASAPDAGESAAAAKADSSAAADSHSADAGNAAANPNVAANDLDASTPVPAADAGAQVTPQVTSAAPAASQNHVTQQVTPPVTSNAQVAPQVAGTLAIPAPIDAGLAAAASAFDAGLSNTQGYYFVIRSSPLTDEKKSPRGSNQRVAYSLATALEAGAPDLEAEPNDDPQHASWIASQRTGFLAPAGDSDWYRVRNEGKSVLRAEVSALTRADLELSIYAPPAHPGEKPALLAHANEGGVREGELLPAVGIDGDALILVQCAPRDLDGVKVRDCEDRDSSYTLSIALAADDGALEREPNDDIDHAQPIDLPAKLTGTLWPKRDVDVFKFQLDAQRTMSFRLSAIRGVDTMLTLRELRTTKKGRAISEVIGTADASRGEGPEEILAVPLKPGAYAIEVSSPKREGSATQSYSLSVQ